MMGFREIDKNSLFSAKYETLGGDSNLGRLWVWRGGISSWTSNFTFFRQWLSVSDLISWTMMLNQIEDITNIIIALNSDFQNEKWEIFFFLFRTLLFGNGGRLGIPMFLLFLQWQAVTCHVRNDAVFKAGQPGEVETRMTNMPSTYGASFVAYCGHI